VSRQTISTITDKVIEGMAEWQNRPLDLPWPSYCVVSLSN
jgi:putative transposase